MGGATKRILGIDIETYSPVPLPKTGVYRYVNTDEFEILLFSYAYDDEPVQTVDLASGEELPAQVLSDLENPDIIKMAYNAQFERVCLSKYMGHWLDPHQWRCTAVMAAALTMPARLADAAVALCVTERKMEEGKDLIRYFSTPCKPTKANGGRTRNRPQDAPDKWAVYKQYNAQDVETERAMRKACERFPLPESEWELYALDQIINDRGVRVDKLLVKQAIKIDKEFSLAAYQRAQQITGLDNPGSVAQLKAWLADQDVPMDSLAKKLVREKADTTDGAVAELLNLRLELSKTSIRKYESIERCVCRDGRIHGTLQFYGANRTGRWSGRLVQLQNVPQNHLPDLDQARDIVKRGDTEMIELFYGSVPNTLSELIRTAFIPRKGCRFIVADFSAIEARVLAWLAGEEWVLEEFSGAGKIYEATASRMYHVPKESIVKGNPNYEYRQKGKQATLSCIAMGSLVLTDKGLVPIEKITEEHRLWDGERWVRHNGIIIRGLNPILHYDGLSATEDHLVYVEERTEPVEFGVAAREHMRLRRMNRQGYSPDVYHGFGNVYDIIDAGPNHRFTVSGCLVHNCGYGGGVGALKKMGAQIPEDEMQPLVDAWREANPHIVALWGRMDRAMRRVITEKCDVDVSKVSLYQKDNKMFIRLPSGRNLCYLSPRISEGEVICYLAPSANGQLVEQETFGGKACENVTQTVARDILAHAMLNLERHGYRIVFHVHDECVMEMPIGTGSVEEACTLMAEPPEWCQDLPLRADGYECESYRKG